MSRCLLLSMDSVHWGLW